jgi:hypothetical protein
VRRVSARTVTLTIGSPASSVTAPPIAANFHILITTSPTRSSSASVNSSPWPPMIDGIARAYAPSA